MFSDILQTVLQSLISVVILFVLTRIMGKKQLSQLTFFDYVVGISIGSIAAAFAVDPSIGYVRGVTALVVYALFPIVLSLIALKSYRARKLLDGKPTILIYNGQLLEANLRKAKLTVNDVLEECRQNNAFNVADVEFAVLETDGRVSVQLKAGKQPLTPQDMNIPAAYQGLCLTLIIDGEVLDDHLKMAGMDSAELLEALRQQGVTDRREVLLAYIGTGKKLVVHKKNSVCPMNPLI